MHDDIMYEYPLSLIFFFTKMCVKYEYMLLFSFTHTYTLNLLHRHPLKMLFVQVLVIPLTFS